MDSSSSSSSSSSPTMDSSKINTVMRKFNFTGPEGSLQYWECVQDGNERRLRVADQVFESTQRREEGLVNYMKRCLKRRYVSVGPRIHVDQELLAALAAQKRDAAYQRTNRHPDQFLGQLVVPLFYYQGAVEILSGVIELVTIRPKESYEADFDQIQSLLKNENLATKPLVNTII